MVLAFAKVLISDKDICEFIHVFAVKDSDSALDMQSDQVEAKRENTRTMNMATIRAVYAP